MVIKNYKINLPIPSHFLDAIIDDTTDITLKNFYVSLNLTEDEKQKIVEIHESIDNMKEKVMSINNFLNLIKEVNNHNERSKEN